MAALTDAQERERLTWQYRAIEATKGNQSKLGTLLLSILGRPARNPPYFGSAAMIDEGGLVVSSFTDRLHGYHYPFAVCDVKEYTTNLSGLADHLKFTDEERIELFRLARQWTATDLRVNAKLKFTKG